MQDTEKVKKLDSFRHGAVARKLQEELLKELPLVHEKLVRAGLFATGQQMHEVVRAAGYEVAELVERRKKAELFG